MRRMRRGHPSASRQSMVLLPPAAFSLRARTIRLGVYDCRFINCRMPCSYTIRTRMRLGRIMR